jgi:outer membrane protein
VLSSQLELNRVRNQPSETPIHLVAASLEEYGFVYARPGIVQTIANLEADRRMRNYLVRVGIARSPDLAAIDAAVAAGERLQTANQRAFWVPSLVFGAGVDYLAAHSGDAPDFNETEWGVEAKLSFPIFQGGAKFARLSQSREDVASLQLERRSVAQEVEQAVRTAFIQASGAFANIALAHTQSNAAKENFELVSQSYSLGVATILSVLDAQSQLLLAQQAVTDAHYNFLDELIAAEQALSLYPFLEPASEMDDLLDGIEQELALQP